MGKSGLEDIKQDKSLMPQQGRHQNAPDADWFQKNTAHVGVWNAPATRHATNTKE